MRLYIVVDTEDRPKVHIPWNYHLSVQSAVYDALNEHAPAMATELHQLEHDPPFSFSEFIPTAPYNVGDDGLAITQGLFAFTSDRSEILDAIASYAIAGNLTLGQLYPPGDWNRHRTGSWRRTSDLSDGEPGLYQPVY